MNDASIMRIKEFHETQCLFQLARFIKRGWSVVEVGCRGIQNLLFVLGFKIPPNASDSIFEAEKRLVEGEVYQKPEANPRYTWFVRLGRSLFELLGTASRGLKARLHAFLRMSPQTLKSRGTGCFLSAESDQSRSH